MIRTKALSDGNCGHHVDASTPFFMFSQATNDATENLQHFAATAQKRAAPNTAHSVFKRSYLIPVGITCDWVAIYISCSKSRFFNCCKGQSN